MLLATALAAMGMDGMNMPQFLADQQRFHDGLTESRWSANPMPYVDGLSSAVLQHPYTVLEDPSDGTIFVSSFTLNHIVRLRMSTKTVAQYKIFVKGAELDGPVGMALDQSESARLLYVASFTNDHILRVDAESGELLGKFGNDEEMDCPEGIALGPDGTLYVVSFLLPYIVRYQPQSGRFLGQFAPPARAGAPTARRGPDALLGAEDIAFDHEGNLHVTAYRAPRRPPPRVARAPLGSAHRPTDCLRRRQRRVPLQWIHGRARGEVRPEHSERTRGHHLRAGR